MAYGHSPNLDVGDLVQFLDEKLEAGDTGFTAAGTEAAQGFCERRVAEHLLEAGSCRDRDLDARPDLGDAQPGG